MLSVGEHCANQETMAIVKHAASEHDVVVLREPVGTWPAGTTGALRCVKAVDLSTERARGQHAP
jgi:hypothetical protein